MEDNKNTTNVLEVQTMEELYPLHDRTKEGYKLIGFVEGAKPSPFKVAISKLYSYGAVPIWKFVGWNRKKNYSGSMLRKLRSERGVGVNKNV